MKTKRFSLRCEPGQNRIRPPWLGCGLLRSPRCGWFNPITRREKNGEKPVKRRFRRALGRSRPLPFEGGTSEDTSDSFNSSGNRNRGLGRVWIPDQTKSTGCWSNSCHQGDGAPCPLRTACGSFTRSGRCGSAGQRQRLIGWMNPAATTPDRVRHGMAQCKGRAHDNAGMPRDRMPAALATLAKRRSTSLEVAQITADCSVRRCSVWAVSRGPGNSPAIDASACGRNAACR